MNQLINYYKYLYELLNHILITRDISISLILCDLWLISYKIIIDSLNHLILVLGHETVSLFKLPLDIPSISAMIIAFGGRIRDIVAISGTQATRQWSSATLPGLTSKTILSCISTHKVDRNDKDFIVNQGSKN